VENLSARQIVPVFAISVNDFNMMENGFLLLLSVYKCKVKVGISMQWCVEYFDGHVSFQYVTQKKSIRLATRVKYLFKRLQILLAGVNGQAV